MPGALNVVAYRAASDQRAVEMFGLVPDDGTIIVAKMYSVP